MLSVRRAGLVAVVVAAMVGLTLEVSSAQALVVVTVDPAPALPALPKISETSASDVVARSVPAAGSTSSGMWTLWSGAPGRQAVTTITMPESTGIALLADWNGDGIATPGRYDGGRWFVTNAVVDSPVWEPLSTFGGAVGDIPIVGQIDKDSRADLGVFRGGVWHWKRANGKPIRNDHLGRAGDIPVVGDWDGDGVDDIGVVRGTTWILQLSGRTKRFTFGRVGDVPVVGDWDGDGRTDPGAMRRPSTWVLSSGLGHVRRVVRQEHAIPDDGQPLVGSQVTSVGDCPTATAEGERYGRAAAAAVRPAKTPQGSVSMPGGAEILSTLQDGLRFAVTNDLTKRLRSRVGRQYYDPLSTHRSIEESVRRSANSALAAAILLTTTNGRDVPGVTRAQLLDYARWQIRSLACQHGAVTPGGWGNGWQSALWAVTAGQAGWLLWPELSGQERAYVAAMVASEAEYAAARGPRYYRNRLGQEITPGDSQADAVSWDLMSPALALAMMPDYGSATKWRNSLIGMSIAAFARPSDLRNPTVVNGVRIDIRLPGTNANEDGTVTNHGIVNPDYIQNVQHLWWAASLLRAGDHPVPEALFLNADIVYRALAVVDFESPPFAEPGGPVYQPLGQIYYPMGVSWGVRRPATFVGVDGFANAYAAPDVRAAEFLAAHAADTRALQMRWTDGHIYADGPTEDSYRLGKEEYALQQMALAWWAGAVKDGLRMSVDTSAYPGISLGRGSPIP